MALRTSKQWWSLWCKLREEIDTVRDGIEGMAYDDWEVLADVTSQIQVAKNLVYRRYLVAKNREESERVLDRCTEEALCEVQVQTVPD